MAKTADATSGKSSGKSSSKLRWVLGWIVVPGLIVSMLFLAGVHVGARHPQGALSRAILWVTGGEAQLGPTSAAERQPLGRRLQLAAAVADFHLKTELTQAELEDFVAAGAGPSIAELDCEAVCKIRWTAKHADREFLRAERCQLTPPTRYTPGIIDCDAKVQR